MQKSPIALAAAICCLFSSSVLAQNQSLPEVTVTTSPVIDSNNTDRYGSYSTSVSAEQIQDLNAVDVASALRKTPGVSISRFNPVGSYGGDEGGAVHIRGMGTTRPGSEIKTYIDDVPFYMGVWNHPLLDLLPINGMSRIEVIKGTQPQRYGNNFASINLVPKQAGETDGVKGDVQLSAGSFQTAVEKFDLVGRSGDLDYALAQGFAQSDGHRADADGKLSNFMGNLGLRLEKEWSVRLLMLQADNKASDPGNLTTGDGKGDTFSTKGQMVTLSLAHHHDKSQGSFKMYSNTTEGIQKSTPTAGNNYDSTSNATGVRWREDWQAWEQGNIAWGLDVDRLDGTAVNTRQAVNVRADQITITSPYVGLSHSASLDQGLTLTPSVGARFYNHNHFGNDSTPHYGAVLKQAGRWALRFNSTSGVNYPGVDVQVIASLSVSADAWKRLNPEKVDHYEIGYSWFGSPDITFDVAVFSDKVKDRYIWTGWMPASFSNVGDYTVTGSEISIQQKLGDGLSLFAGLTNLLSSKTDLPYSPSSALSVGVNWQADDWRVSADLQNQSGMTVLKQDRSGTANTAKVDGFTLVNLRVGYKLPTLGKRGEVFVAAENLTDQTYYFRTGYPMPGMSAQVGLKASF